MVQTTPTVKDIRLRVDDAQFLWKAGRLEGAFALVLIAVAAAARRTRPRSSGDRKAFEGYLLDHFPWRITVDYQGALMPLERVFYELLRCQLLHEAGFAADVQFLSDVEPHELVVRAGGKPEHILRLSPGWFHKLAEIALAAT